MNGVHDMGGMHGFGPVLPEKDEPIFHESWEGRVFAMSGQLSRFGGNIDARRFAIEQIRPDRYLALSYYERWFERALRYCTEMGLISARERAAIDSGNAKEDNTHVKVGRAPAPAHNDYARPLSAPALFAIGNRVRAKLINPATHTRLPRYARGKTGVIVADHAGHVFPDSNAIGKGEDPSRLYTVRFTARELWGDAANPNDTVSLDLWEPYLERVQS
jgi:nitrile hydratase